MGGNDLDHGEIADLLKSEGITGLAIVAGDKHSFWAGTFSKYLPPRPFEPLAVEFITGSISAQGMTEVAEINFPKTHPLRALYLYDAPDGRILPSVNMTFLHGVRSSLKLKETGDVQAALALSNPEQSPNLSFVDMGGHGYATVRVSPAEMVTEFVCIPRPFERAETPDGGPLAYRLRHRVPLWRAGKPARMEQQLVEGKLPI
jgi:alkaline phosphatase D